MNAAAVERALPAGAPAWDRAPRVDHQNTIPRKLAHKRRLENVYVTSLCETDARNQFLFGAFVPQSNAYINDMRVHAGDVTLSIIEIGRQIGIALSHEFLGVAPQQTFVLDTMVFEALPAMGAHDWRANDTLWGHATIDQQVHNGEGELSSARADGRIQAGNDLVCTQSSNWSILPRERYLRLRELSRARNERRMGEAGDTASLGPGFMVSLDAQLRQPVLEAGLWVSSNASRFVATLHVDRRNLFFFDHDNDHVPGMLVLEGMRAMALDIVGKFRLGGDGPAALRRIEVAFKNFAELDAPVQLVATLDPHRSDDEPLALHVEARQLGRAFATGDFIAA
ncbi:AfsA-related hotdog domain-containing protein [Sphaerotilaceae bacterium SBD11-9]